MNRTKILILGGCGSGKSYLAKRLSKTTNIPHYDLDNVTKKGNSFEKVSDKTRDLNLKKILINKEWIIEGAYAGEWIEPAVENAESVIILNMKPILAKKRIITRFLKRKLRIKKDKKSPIKDLPKLLDYAQSYPKDYFIKHQELCKKFNKQPIILTNKKQVNEFPKKVGRNKDD